MTEICKTYNDFYDFYIQHIKSADTVAFDCETNAEETHSNAHKVVGFSLATNNEVGCYVPIISIDFNMKQNDVEDIKELLKDILNSKNIMVYNCLHELPVLLNWLDIEIPIERLDDLFVLVKMMMGNANKYRGHGGLKEQSVNLLGVKDWSEDLDNYFKLVRNFYTFKSELRELLLKYYAGGEVNSVIDKIEYAISHNTYNINNNDCISYGFVPYNLISKYGAEDSCILFSLRDYYINLVKAENERLGINLFDGYRVWMKHHYCGYLIERNGAYWNDKKATELEEWCNTTMYNCLRNIIKSNLSIPYLKSALYGDYLEYVKDKYIGEIFGSDYIPVRRTANIIEVTAQNNNAALKLINLNCPSKTNKKGTTTYKINNNQLKELCVEFNNNRPEIFENWFNGHIDEFVANKSNINDLKKLINPSATSEDFRGFVSNLLITDEIKIARLYLEFINIVRDPLYDNDYYKDFYSATGEKKNVLKYKLYPFPPMEQFKEDYPDMKYYDTFDSKLIDTVYKIDKFEQFTDSRKFELFKKINLDGTIKNKKLKKAVELSSSMTIETLDSDNLNKIYDAYTLLGMDIEDSSTWNERFTWLVNFKMFKKMEKLVSTYINGKIGRKSVYFVNKKSYSNGDVLSKRLMPYNDCPELINDNMYTTMIQTNFGVNMASTGRWTSGFHNIPAGECIKSLYTSRFKGGCLAMPDGSQMEVRALAAESGDENLFRAFNEGLDIHKYFASKIYKVEYEDVTSRQRSLAKGAVFGLIYGMEIHSFAESYTKGNIKEATEIYNALYDRFPKVKEYIERAHNEFNNFGKVTTLTNRYINLDTSKNKKALKRESQNYKIQGYAADLAGLIMFEIQNYITTHNMKSKLICMVHDSIEIDMHPDEVFELVDVINKAFNEYPMKEFGVPVACDVPLSANMGAECKIKGMAHSDDYNEVVISLEGYIKDIDELFNVWKNEAYDFVEYIGEEEYAQYDEDEYQPWSAMMGTGKSIITKYSGTTLKKGQRKIHIIRKR